MTVTITQMGKGVLLTVDDVRRFKRDLRLATEAIEELETERVSLLKKLDAASLFLDVTAIDEAEEDDVAVTSQGKTPSIPISKQSQTAISARPQLRSHSTGEPAWSDLVIDAVARAEMGLTYAEMRAVAAMSVLGPKLQASDKGYHAAIGRLAREGTIVREHGRLFIPDAFKRFMAAVDAGQASTTVPQPIAHSPMGEAILTIVANCPGQLNGKGVIGKLRHDPEFDAALTPHETGAYNIIARLVRREQIIRRDDGFLIPGRNFPRDRGVHAPLRNGALNGHADSAPPAGEVAASPNNDPSSFRLIG